MNEEESPDLEQLPDSMLHGLIEDDTSAEHEKARALSVLATRVGVEKLPVRLKFKPWRKGVPEDQLGSDYMPLWRSNGETRK